MFSKKNVAELALSDEQLKKYKEFEVKEKALRRVLKKCNVYPNAIDSIVSNSDLNKVDLNNLDALEENVKETWDELIIPKGDTK